MTDRLAGAVGDLGGTGQEHPAAVADGAGRTSPAGGTVRWWRRVPAIVWVVTGLSLALMCVCSLLYPPFTGYDEVWHVDMTWSYYQGNGVYGPAQRLIDRGVEVANDSVQVPPPRLPYADAPILPRDQRESFSALDDGKPITYLVPNQMVQHPPLYYLVEAGLLHAVPGGDRLPYDQQVWLLRLFSMLMVAPLPLLFWATASRLTGDGRVGTIASMLPMTMPGLARLGGSVNNDNLLILLGSLLLYLLARVVGGDLSKRTGLLVGVVCTLALVTKGFALAYPVVIAAAYGAAWYRHRHRPFAPLGIATLLVAGLGSVWWVRNVVLYHSVQPAGIGAVWFNRLYGMPRPGGTVQDFIPGFFHRLLVRIWGGFGLIDIPQLPEPVVYGWFFLVAAGALIAIGYGVTSGTRSGRLSAAVFALPFILITGMLFAGAIGGYLFNLRYAGVQGRYLYSTLGGLAALAAWGWSRLAGRAARFLPLFVVLAGLLTQAAAWILLLRSWWAPRNGIPGPERIRQALGGVLRWSPWPEGATFAPFVLVVVLSLVLLGLVTHTAFRPGTNDARRRQPTVDRAREVTTKV